MSVNEDGNNTKINNNKMKSPIYCSPFAHKKKVIGNLYTEPRKTPSQSSSVSKSKIKPKISSQMTNKNAANIQSQDNFKKSLQYLSVTNKSFQDKKNIPQSYKKLNAKLYLKKNVIPNLSTFNDPYNKSLTNRMSSTSNMNLNTENNYSRNTSNLFKIMPVNMKMNNINSKEASLNFKKIAGSTSDLFGNNNIKKAKTKTKNSVNLNNISPIEYIFGSGGNSNRELLSSQNGSKPKIFFVKNEKKQLKDEYGEEDNINKDSLKVIPSSVNEQINNNNTNNTSDEKNKSGVQYLLRNTYNNVKIYPTTFLNNKIIYQTENETNENSISNENKDTIVIEPNQKQKKNLNIENPKTVEEVHFLYVYTIQNGKNLVSKMDKNYAY